MATATVTRITTSVSYKSGLEYDGDHLVWADDRGATTQVFAYTLSTATEFAVNANAQSQSNPELQGDTIAWEEHDGTHTNVWTYSLSTTTAVAASPQLATQTLVAVTNVAVVWRDERAGNLDLYAQLIGTTGEIAIQTGPERVDDPAAHGDYVYYSAPASGEVDDRVWEYRISTGVTRQLAGASPWSHFDFEAGAGGLTWIDETRDVDDVWFADKAGNPPILLTDDYLMPNEALLSNYDVVLFGDDLDDRYALEWFDAANAAGTPILAIGTAENEEPMVEILVDVGRYGIVTDDGYDENPVTVIRESSEFNHPIWDGVGPVISVQFENESADEMDEQSIDVDLLSPNAPADWVMLAVFGPEQDEGGESAIVTFTTPEGTRVLLDGATPTADEYRFWTYDRWRVLYNEITWLADGE